MNCKCIGLFRNQNINFTLRMYWEPEYSNVISTTLWSAVRWVSRVRSNIPIPFYPWVGLGLGISKGDVPLKEARRNRSNIPNPLLSLPLWSNCHLTAGWCPAACIQIRVQLFIMHIFHVPPLSQFLLGAGPRPGGRAFTLEQPPVNAAIKCLRLIGREQLETNFLIP